MAAEPPSPDALDQRTRQICRPVDVRGHAFTTSGQFDRDTSLTMPRLIRSTVLTDYIVEDMPFGSDWRRLWVGNRQEWQIARAAGRNLVLRGDSAALDRREHQLCHPLSRGQARLGPGASPPPLVRRSCARSASAAPGSNHPSAAVDRHRPAPR
jgi:hypothetical protein